MLAVAVRLAFLVPSFARGLSGIRSPADAWVGQISSDSSLHLGDLLMDAWLAPFLVVAVLLTVVLVAALGLVRKDAA